MTAVAMVDIDLYNAVIYSSSFDKHFYRPTISHLPHCQAGKRPGADSAEGADIMQRNSIAQTNQTTDHPVTQARMWWNSPLLRATTNPRAHRQIRPAFQQRREQQGQISRVVTAIAIHK